MGVVGSDHRVEAEGRSGYEPHDLIDDDIVARLDAPILRELHQRGLIDGLIGLRPEHHQRAATALEIVVEGVDNVRDQRTGRTRHDHHSASLGHLVLGDQIDLINFVAFAVQRLFEMAHAAAVIGVVGIVFALAGEEANRLASRSW